MDIKILNNQGDSEEGGEESKEKKQKREWVIKEERKKGREWGGKNNCMMQWESYLKPLRCFSNVIKCTVYLLRHG